MIVAAVLLIKVQQESGLVEGSCTHTHTHNIAYKTKITCFKLINFKTIPHEENVRSAFGSVTKWGGFSSRGAAEFSFTVFFFSPRLE